MPVRKIPKNHLVVTGAFSSAKADRVIGFESTLEKEYMLLLDFDEQVERYEEQPVRVPVPGVARGYVVDLLVHFCSPDRPPELTEVKTEADLERKRDDYRPKFAAAEAFCQDRGWSFVIKTDKDIRTPRLKNLKFLRRYRNAEPSKEQTALVLAWLESKGGRSTSETLATSLAPTANERAPQLPVIWNLLLTGRLCTDLNTDMPVDVPLWLPGCAP
jgi:TnsA endonuclease N terminal/TnsA endonuclease C terminal